MDVMTPVADATSPTTAVTGGRVERVTATLVLAFAADPVIRWVLPAPGRYVTFFPEIVGALGEPAFQSGTADLSEDDAGAALWVPPGASTDEETLAGLVASSVDPDRHPAMFSLLEQMDQHHPTEPHWYLPFIGVEPTRQGRGVGALLLRRGLERADRDGLPAYLEASSPRNRALYERHGFVATAEIRAADSPPLWPMLREPAAR